MRFNISQIDIGDLISCLDKFPSRNYSTYQVTNKLDKTILIVEKIGDAESEKRMIDIKDIVEVVQKHTS
ncbi:hypothetical protein [Ferruginibacter albus]|uniref:hypothetical protein n=1 Tax=Ferruginibacter albus TaxID=2875540 RepID=UPI001CC36F42|nr:hypothetical protein [Ferruginibacter albus]UAY51272.1 hypothetical protein K9M53_11805 [Ferruginibacter albus]